MGIVRVSKRDRWVTIDKTGLEDSRLSFKAKGLLAFLLSKPDNWQARISHLAKVGPDGNTAVRSGLNELEEYGYLIRKPVRNDDGTIKEWESIIYEIPGNCPEVENPQQDIPRKDNRQVMNYDCNERMNNKTEEEDARTRTHGKKIPIKIKAKYEEVFQRELSAEMYDKILKIWYSSKTFASRN